MTFEKLAAAIIDSLNARTLLHNVYTFLLMIVVLVFFSPSLKVCSQLLFSHKAVLKYWEDVVLSTRLVRK